MTKDTPRSAPIKHLADRYAAELTAQFQTLNLFAQHAGEIGRTHEVFLRTILQRFLPGKFRCGTGFVANARGVSRQQDIIVFEPSSLPLLFEVGDCLVVDANSVAGTVEVKTALGSTKALDNAIRSTIGRHSFAAFSGLYAWQGLTLDRVLDYIWAKYRAAPNLAVTVLPSALYVRGRYVLYHNWDGRRDTPPLQVLQVGKGKHTEGEALLTFVAQMWICALQRQAEWPWWLSDWYERRAEICEFIDWPVDLKKRAIREQKEPR